MAAETPFDTMIGRLRDLRAALASAGIRARMIMPGTSRAALQISDPVIEVTCRASQADGQWWFWAGPEPLAAAGDQAAATKVIQIIPAAGARQ
jgi:hypothetical protein